MSSAIVRALRRKTADLRGLGDIRLCSLEDGPGRGNRLLLCRNAAGIECEISVDRGFDVSALRWRGMNLGWNGPAGGEVPHTALEGEAGLGLLRSFDGFLVTCGLDHYGAPATGPAAAFNYPLRERIHRPLHGRVSSLRASLRGHGLETHGDRPYLWCEAQVRQAALFAEVLVLRRRVEIDLFEPVIRIRDAVTNEGSRPARHVMLYHFNLGYPLLDEHATLTGSWSPALLADFAAHPAVAVDDARESFEVDRPDCPADGWGHVGLGNARLAGGCALDIAYSAATLPALGLWRAYQSGVYALGLEPLTGIEPDGGYQGPGTPHYLEPGATRAYAFDVTVRPAAAAVP